MKPKRIQVEVRPGKVWNWDTERPCAGWHVFIEGASVEVLTRKKSSVYVAVMFAAQLEPSELTIKGRDGRIQDRRTYPRSSDPRRSRG